VESVLIEPFRDEGVRNGALAAMAVGLLCGTIGCFVVIRGVAMFADSLAHGILPGVAVAILVWSGAEGPPELGLLGFGLTSGLITATATALLLRSGRFRSDTATAVVFVAMLALGVAIFSGAGDDSIELEEALFGDVLDVSGGDLALIAALCGATLVPLAFLYRPFTLAAFNRARATSLGVAVGRVELGMMMLLAVTIVIGFQVFGALLVMGLTIAPPATASLLVSRMPAMIAVSSAIAAVSGPLGLLVSWHLDVAAGASIVLVAVAIFVAVLLLRPSRA